MSVISIVFAIMGVCLCWLPGWGWLGMALGGMAVGVGMPAITHWYKRPGSTGFGIAGIILGEITLSVGLAYQIKHAAGAADFIFFSLQTRAAFPLLAVAILLGISGLIIARRKHRPVGLIIAAFAFTFFFVAAGWTLLTADRQESSSRTVIQSAQKS